MNARDRAVRLLEHYFSLLAKKAGLHWDGDNNAEIGEIVDSIIEAARDAKDWRQTR